jgi:hypothetical protein
MRRTIVLSAVAICFVALLSLHAFTAPPDKGWSIKASYIEACSCELFCACYFNTAPDKDFCKFNNAIMITSGHAGNVKLDGIKFWMAGDLGGDFTKGFREVIVTFEPSATKEQVDGTMAIIAKLYPGEWGSVKVAEERMPIMWEVNGHNGHAKLGDGKAEVKLAGFVGNDGKTLVKINNLTYWGAQKNNGFVLAKGTHHYKGEGLDYSFEDSNGFFIDIESSGS